jgi:hypothetical protein
MKQLKAIITCDTPVQLPAASRMDEKGGLPIEFSLMPRNLGTTLGTGGENTVCTRQGK